MALAAPLLLAGCIEDAGVPQLGPCSNPPDLNLYEFGQVDIGTCISSPSDLQVVADPQDPSNHLLYVVNSNAYSNFTGSSLLTIDAASIDLTCPVNGMHEVAANAVGMQEFAGRLAIDESRNLGLLSGRVNGQFDGDLTDVVFTLDVSDPRAVTWSDLGSRRWGPFRYVQVPADPWSIRINPWNGRAYVLGLTGHEVSALDLVSDPLRFLDLRGDLSVGAATFDDADGSGSAPDFTLTTVIPTQVEDEVLTLRFQEGTTRLFHGVLDADGSPALHALNAGDGVSFVPLAGGAIVSPDPAIAWAVGGLAAAAVGFIGDGTAALLTGYDATGKRSVGRMSGGNNALDWTVGGTAAIPPSTDGALWDTTGTFDPDWIVDLDGTVRAWFSGGPGWGTAIGHAEGAGLGSLARSGDPALPDGAAGQVLTADEDISAWDGGAVFAPAVLRDGASGDLHLYYTGHDGVALGDLPGLTAIGLATSEEGLVYERQGVVLEAGELGDWDGVAVGWPTVFFDNGRWHMWYRGFDGDSWRVGRATSIDGRAWARDPRNPVVGDALTVTDPDAPLRLFAQKVSPVSGYQVGGPISGDVAALAQEGLPYENTVSPIGFLVVGGQALGRGPAGSYDRDGAAAAGRIGDTDLIAYAARQGTRARLAVARDQGAGAERLNVVTGADWIGALDGLNGSEPTVALHEPDVQLDGDTAVVAFSTSVGIGLGHLALNDRGLPDALLPVADGLAVIAGAEDAFDSAGVSAPALVLDGHDGAVRVFYEGARGESSSIGVAVASAVNGAFEPGVQAFARGGAGAWDDAAVGSPTVLWDAAAQRYHLWYLGFDGEATRMGHATSPDGLDWTREADGAGITFPVFDAVGLPFTDSSGLHAIRVRPMADGRYELWFEGRLDGVPRIGRAISDDGLSWSTITNPTTAGDTFTLLTRKGDTNASTGIHLGEPPRQGEDAEDVLVIDGFRIHGAGVSEMVLSPDGQFAVVANKRTNILTVLDLRDDSTDTWTDANVNGVEAIFRIPQRFGVVGARDMVFSPDGERLHVLLAPLVVSESNDASLATGVEALLSFDWTLVQDTAEGTLLLDDAVLFYAPLARGVEEDVGYRTDVSVGPSALALSADGTRAYVTNYNDNSLWIVALDAGARGAIIERVQPLDEAPGEVALSPDGRLAYVANYVGWSRNLVTHSTIQVVDVDEASPTFGEVLTTLTNIESRSDRGCP